VTDPWPALEARERALRAALVRRPEAFRAYGLDLREAALDAREARLRDWTRRLILLGPWGAQTEAARGGSSAAAWVREARALAAALDAAPSEYEAAAIAWRAEFASWPR